MAFANYASPARETDCLVREKNSWLRWMKRLIIRTSTSSSFISTIESALEDEIYSLRIRMEQMYAAEQSLTAPRVVEISMLLDEKINQWMQMEKSQSR